MEKEKIQNIFRNILMLIFENNKVIINKFSKINKLIHSNYTFLSKRISGMNSQFSSYQLRPNYDKDPEYIEGIKQLMNNIEESKNKLKELEENSEFLIGQTKLDIDKLSSLINDIMFMIDDL